MRLLLPIAFSLSLAAGQSGRVEGKVVSTTGDALSKVGVKLGPANATTDNSGRFVFDDVSPGRYTLSAEKAGFGAQGNAVVLNLKAGTELKDLVVRLTPLGVITGKVRDQDGDPVARAAVGAMRYEYVRGRQLVGIADEVTDDQGDYRIADLMPGRYYVRAAEPPALSITRRYGDLPGRATREGMEGNVVTYYPGAPDGPSGSAIEITPGLTARGIDIRLRRVRVYSVKGKMVNASDGRPAAGCLLQLVDGENYGLARVQTDGTFEFRNVPSGTFELIANQLCGGFTAQPEVTVAASNIEGINVSLIPNAPIPGIVTVEAGDLPQLGIGLVSPPSGSSTRVKPDGTFELPSSGGAGKFAWSVYGLPEGTYVKSVHFSGQDVTRAPIDNTSGAGGKLQFVLSNKAARLTGTAPKGTTVRLWPKIPDLGSYGGGLMSTATDQDGGFEFTGLAPGEYYVAAWDALDPGLAQSAEFLGRFDDDAAPVKLDESGQGSVEVKLISPERVAAEIARLP